MKFRNPDTGDFIEIPTLQGTHGYSPKITVNTDTPTDYILTITTKTDSFNTPNLKSDSVNVAMKLGIYGSGTLIAGESNITITNSNFTEDMSYSIYTSVYGISPSNVSVANGSVTLSFDAQAENIGVKVVGMKLD